MYGNWETIEGRKMNMEKTTNNNSKKCMEMGKQ
jgi:hypothetical protein